MPSGGVLSRAAVATPTIVWFSSNQLPPPSLPFFFFLKPTPDLTTRKRSHFWEVTSMHVPCWVVTFDFLRPFMSRTHQAGELQAHFMLVCAPFQWQWWRQNHEKLNAIYPKQYLCKNIFYIYFDVLWQWSMVFGLWINFIGIRKNNNIILLCTCDVTKCTSTKQVFQISKEFL